MSKIMQNLVVLMDPIDPDKYASDISVKASNMCLNTFCIDEDAAFEISGVNFLYSLPKKYIDDFDMNNYRAKGYLRLQ